MKAFKNIFFALLGGFLFLSLPAAAQNKTDYQKLNRDLDILQEALYTTHPGVFEYISKDSLDRLFSELHFQSPEGANKLELERRVRIILSRLGCIHTSLTGEPALEPPKARLPFQLHAEGNDIYILKDLSDSLSGLAGGRILAINGHPAHTIINAMLPYHASDGYNQSFQYKLANAGSRFSFFYAYYFDTDSLKTYLIETPAGDTLRLRRSQNKKTPAPTAKKAKSEKSPYGKHISLNLYEDEHFAVMEIRSFHGSVAGNKKHYRQIIKLLNQHQIPNLVIDLRGNLGGDASAANALISHFLSQPHTIDRERKKSKMLKKSTLMTRGLYGVEYLFKIMFHKAVKTDSSKIFYKQIKPNSKVRYHGKVFILTDGFTASAASLVASVLQQKAHASVIGEESGGGAEAFNAFFRPVMKLPYSHIKIHVPLYRIHLHLKEDKGHGVIPDFSIHYTLQELQNGRDPEMEKVREMIRNEARR